MRKIYVVAGIAGVVALGSVGAYAFINASQPKDIVVKEEVAITKNTHTPSATSVPTVAPTPTVAPIVAEPVPVTPAPAPAVQAPAESAPQSSVEYTPVDPMTRQWTDGYGNQYVGPNAVSCADGSAPVTIGHGMPLQCALNLGNAELLE